MTHASVPADVRAEIGISDALVRLSVGVEDLERPHRRFGAGVGG
jgi:cystathionine gamma-lyase